MRRKRQEFLEIGGRREGGRLLPRRVGSCKCECARVVLETILRGSRLLIELDSSNTRTQSVTRVTYVSSEYSSEVNESHNPTRSHLSIWALLCQCTSSDKALRVPLLDVASRPRVGYYSQVRTLVHSY